MKIDVMLWWRQHIAPITARAKTRQTRRRAGQARQHHQPIGRRCRRAARSPPRWPACPKPNWLAPNKAAAAAAPLGKALHQQPHAIAPNRHAHRHRQRATTTQPIAGVAPSNAIHHQRRQQTGQAAHPGQRGRAQLSAPGGY